MLLRGFVQDLGRMVAALVVVLALLSTVGALGAWALLSSAPEVAAHSITLPFLAPALLALLSVAALFWVGLRGPSQWGHPIADASLREAFMTTGLAAVLFGVASLALPLGPQASGRGLRFLAASIVAFVPLSLSVLILRFLTRQGASVARLGALSLVILCLYVSGPFALDTWGDRKLKGLEAALSEEAAGERQKVMAERLEVVSGEPVEENAAPRYRAVAEALEMRFPDRRFERTLNTAALAGSRNLEADAERARRSSASEIESLRVAARSTRCDWFEGREAAPLPSPYGPRLGADLLVLQGNTEAAAGDVSGALMDDLAALRMGCDYETSGAVAGIGVAFALEGKAIEGLLEVLSSESLAPLPPPERLEAKLVTLETRLTTAGKAYRQKRLALARIDWGRVDTSRLGFSGLPTAARALLPKRFFVADLASAESRLLEEAERLSAKKDPKERALAFRALLRRAEHSPNALVQVSAPTLLGGALGVQDYALTRFRTVLTVVALERSFEANGRYPQTADGLTLPADPLAAPAPFRYEVLQNGNAYRLFSAPEVPIDGTGITGETGTVFERPARKVALPPNSIRKPR